jgi:hypothetical protein
MAPSLPYACPCCILIETPMPYINELVPDADMVRHDLSNILRAHAVLDVDAQWTVDRDHDAFLMQLGSNPQDPGMSEFLFFWEGQMHEELLRSERLPAAQGQRHLRWHRLTAAAEPTAAPEQQQARLIALKEALTAFRSDGLFSAASVTYVIDFAF